jgi:hypothetical protein
VTLRACTTQAVQSGLIEIVGDVLWVYTWSDLEYAIAGSPTIDVDQVVMWRVIRAHDGCATDAREDASTDAYCRRSGTYVCV